MRIGTGLQNKLLEAMSMKIPSVTTPLANAALKAEPGKEILIGENAGQLAENLIKLLENKDLAKTITENAFDFVHKNFSWSESTLKLSKLMEEA